MKVFTKLDTIHQLIEARKIGFIKCFADDKTIIANTSEVNLSPEQINDYLDEFISGLEGEYIQVKMYKNEKDNFPLQHYIKLNQDQNTNTSKSEAQPNNLVIGLINQMNDLRLEMQRKEFDQERKELERKIEEVRKERKENPMHERLLKLGSDLLLQSKTPAQAPAPIVTPATAAPIVKNKAGIFGTGEKEKFIQVTNRWKNADPEFILVMEKIVSIAENNPDTYQMYKGMLT